MDATYSHLIESGPSKYLQKMDSVIIQPGRNRIKIIFPVLYDRRIENTSISWASNTKNLNVPIIFGQRTEVVIDNLSEALYDFSLLITIIPIIYTLFLNASLGLFMAMFMNRHYKIETLKLL
ncbi:MAG: DUF4998 domain-containing protein [Paludibacteraceae bacterium]